MKAEISEVNIFLRATARFHDLLYVAVHDKQLEQERVPHSIFLSYYEEEWFDVDTTNWNPAAMCIVKKPTEKMVAVGEEGEVLTYVGGKLTTEKIRPKPSVLRGITVVDGFAFACGMKREVYKRTDEKKWVAMNVPAQKENGGLEAIAGFNSKEIYAVGWNGEIWQWNGKKWTNHKSPVDIILTATCCAEDGKAYICGQNGTLIVGRNDKWQLIKLKNMRDDFWNICWFNDTLYVASLSILYTLKDNRLIPVNFGKDSPRTFHKLSQAEGILWSVGTSDVFSFDGKKWMRVD